MLLISTLTCLFTFALSFVYGVDFDFLPVWQGIYVADIHSYLFGDVSFMS